MRLPGWPWHDRPAAVEEPWFLEPGDATPEVLDRFAKGPLSPDPAALVRVGETVQSAFREAGRERAASSPSRPSRRMRTLVAAGTVAALLVSTAGLAAAESGPGQPFYRTRLAVEAAFLPPAGSPARMDADVRRGQARLAEASRAAAAADWNAEADAMGAYLDVVTSIPVPSDPIRRQLLQQQLAQQMRDLERLREGSNGGAATEVGRAIDQVGRLSGESPGATPAPGSTGNGSEATPGAGPSAGQGQGPGQSSGGGPQAGSSGSPGPASTAGGPGQGGPGQGGQGQGGSGSTGPGGQGGVGLP